MNGIAELFNTRIDPLENGDHACLSEVYTFTSSSGAPMTTFGDTPMFMIGGRSSNNYYGKILLSVLSSDGQTKWERSIDRIQSCDDENCKSDLIFRDNEIVVVFMDGKSAYVNFYNIATGDMNQHSFYVDRKKRDPKILPSHVKKINKNRFLLYSKKKDRVQFGLLIFE